MSNGNRGAVFGTDNSYSKSGVSISPYDNIVITWGVAEKINMGLETDLFGKVVIQADMFSEYRSHILMTRAYLPGYLGLLAYVHSHYVDAAVKGLEVVVVSRIRQER